MVGRGFIGTQIYWDADLLGRGLGKDENGFSRIGIGV